MPYVNVTPSEAGDNTASCRDLVAYLEKENRRQEAPAKELWFDQTRGDISPREIEPRIDNNIRKLKKKEAKFFLVNISPSEKELAHIGSDPNKLKAYAREVMEQYAHNFGKGVEGKDLLYFGKLEYNRYYKYSDAEVKAGLNKRGEIKQGNHLHVQIIVSRKDNQNNRLLSPHNTSSGKNEKHTSKYGKFNQVDFKHNVEQAFDRLFEYSRELEDTFRYLNKMQNGSVDERVNLLLEVKARDRKRREAEKEVSLKRPDVTQEIKVAQKQAPAEEPKVPAFKQQISSEAAQIKKVEPGKGEDIKTQLPEDIKPEPNVEQAQANKKSLKIT